MAKPVRVGVAGTPTAASVLALLDGIERHGPNAPATIAFRAALKRKGAEAYDSGGRASVEQLLQEVAAAEPDRAETRVMLLREARSDDSATYGPRP